MAAIGGLANDLLRKSSNEDSNYFEPPPRYFHFASDVEKQLYVIGGHTLERRRMERIVDVFSFDPWLESWQGVTATGHLPQNCVEGACAAIGSNLYIYGGEVYNRMVRQYSCSLHQLDTKTMIWTRLQDGPSQKSGCRMISYGDKLLLFGGFGIPSTSTQPGAEFYKRQISDRTGWTNELHTYDIKEGELGSIIIHALILQVT